MKNHTSESWTEEDQKNSEPDFYGKWVSVEDRLPEEKPFRFQSVIVAKENGTVLQAWYNTKVKSFMKNNLSLVDLNHKVTHWMPWPEPPTDTQLIYELAKKIL